MNRFISCIFLFAALLGLTSCFEPSGAGSSSQNSSQSPASNILFDGAFEAKNTVTGISVRWMSAGLSVQGYRIYRISGGNRNLLATVGPEATSYIDGTVYWGQIYNYLVKSIDAKGLEDRNGRMVTSLAWGGIQSVVASGRSTLTVNMAGSAPAVDEVRIYLQPDGGERVLAATITGNDLQTTLSGLRVGSRYKVSAQAYLNSLRKEDGNTIVVNSYTKTEGFHEDGATPRGFQNVLNVRAFGDAPGAPTSPTNALKTPKTRQIEVIWKPFYNHENDATEYVVVRTLDGYQLDTASKTACTASTDTSCMVCRTKILNGVYPNCLDDKIKAPPARYRYAISMVHFNSSTNEEWTEPLPQDQIENFSVVVPVPPENMVLVQRDAVNQEVCTLMGRTPDPINKNRCSYTGIGAAPYSTGHNKPPLNLSSIHYDFGYNLFVDRFEAACNWTNEGGKCDPSSSPGNPVDGPCIGTNLPTVDQGEIGQIYYMVQTWTGSTGSTDRCLIKTHAGWAGFDAGQTDMRGMPTSQLSGMITNDPRGKVRAAITNVPMFQANVLCQAKVDPSYGEKRLPRLREKQAFLAWPTMDPGDPYYISPTVAANLEAGSSSYTSRCVTRNRDDQADRMFPSPAPVTVSDLMQDGNYAGDISISRYRRHVIGSEKSADCVSRYGVQDGVGNLREFVSDVFLNYSSQTLTGGISPVDNGNRDLAGVRMDGLFGSGGSSVGFNAWVGFTATSVNSVAVPLGLPLATTSSVYTPRVSLNTMGDQFQLYPTSPVDGPANGRRFSYSIYYGAFTDNGGAAGRFSMFVEQNEYDKGAANGFRCVLPAE